MTSSYSRVVMYGCGQRVEDDLFSDNVKSDDFMEEIDSFFEFYKLMSKEKGVDRIRPVEQTSPRPPAVSLDPLVSDICLCVPTDSCVEEKLDLRFGSSCQYGMVKCCGLE